MTPNRLTWARPFEVAGLGLVILGALGTVVVRIAAPVPILGTFGFNEITMLGYDRARYDGERTAAAFAERLRDQVDLVTLESDVIDIVAVALRPTSASLWIRSAPRHAPPRPSP